MNFIIIIINYKFFHSLFIFYSSEFLLSSYIIIFLILFSHNAVINTAPQHPGTKNNNAGYP